MKRMLKASGMLFLAGAIGFGATTTYADESNGPQERRETRQEAEKEEPSRQTTLAIILLLLSMIR